MKKKYLLKKTAILFSCLFMLGNVTGCQNGDGTEGTEVQPIESVETVETEENAGTEETVETEETGETGESEETEESSGETEGGSAGSGSTGSGSTGSGSTGGTGESEETKESEETEETKETEENSGTTGGNTGSGNTGSGNSGSGNTGSGNTESGSTGAGTTQKSDVDLTGYSLVWEDEFTGNSLNRDNWNVELHDPGWVNSELQSYIDSEENIYVKDGLLVIQPIKTVGEDGSVSYTSGRISSQNKQTFTYGYFEARCKVPEGQGYLPAFWLMANDESVYGQWPKCGEIDIMEVMGQDTKTVYGTIHYGNPYKQSQETCKLTNGDFSDEFHVFSCEWEPGSIKWYVDGNLYHEEHDWYSQVEGQGMLSYPAPFDQPFYVILNLAVGGSWVGNPDDTTTFDTNYEVDYVKVYQKDSYDENVSRPEKEPVALRQPNADGNYINNGNFAVSESLTDDADWKFMTALGGEAEAVIGDQTMTIKTKDEGTVDYSVQLVQANVPFEKGATYEVSFDAYASADRTMKTAIKAPDFNYCEYMESKTVSLTTELKTYTYTFKMGSDTDPNGRLEFNMGAAGSAADIYIQNVSVRKIAEADPTEEEEKTILADGNYVYNSSFQEGEGHLGNWIIDNQCDAVYGVTGFADGRRLHVTIANPTEKEGFVVLQKDLALAAGNAYKLSFEAEVNEDQTITAVVGGTEYTVALTAGKHGYEVEIPNTLVYADKNLSFQLGTVNEIYLDQVKIMGAAKIQNGSFDNGIAGYEMYVDSSASASYGLISEEGNHVIDIDISNTSDQDWKIQLKQNNVSLEKGKWYRLVIHAKSTMDRDIRVIMQGSEARGWAVYSGENTISLTNEWTTYTKDFQMTDTTDLEAFLSICLGNVGKEITTEHHVYLDQISLEEIEAPANEPEQNTPGQDTSETDLPVVGENILKNADFSNGLTNWIETIANWGGDYITVASSSIADGAITYTIDNPGSEDWHVQLKQSKLPLEAGCTYQVSYTIKSSSERQIKSGVMSTDYNWYGGSDPILPANEEMEVTFEFTMSADDLNADFYISLGKIAGEDTPNGVITISNLSFIKK